jgi:hypothetical protein
VANRDGDVNRAVTGWVGKQLPERRGRPVAQGGALTAGQHRRHLLGQRGKHRADQIDAAVRSPQATCLQSSVDPVGTDTSTEELTAGDHPVLASCQRGDGLLT